MSRLTPQQRSRTNEYRKKRKAELHPQCTECGEFRKPWGCRHCMDVVEFANAAVGWHARQMIRRGLQAIRIQRNLDALFNGRDGGL